MLRSTLYNTSRALESLGEVAGIQSFVLAVDPNDPSDMGFLGGSIVGREFWRGMRFGGEAGAKTFKAQCLRELESQSAPPFGREEAPSSRASSVSAKGPPAKSVKNTLYENVRKALSGVRTAEMKWTNPERLDVFGVRVVGWPASIPALNPSQLKVSQNKVLLESLENGTMRFEKLFPGATTDYADNCNDEGTIPDEADDFDDDFSWAYDADDVDPTARNLYPVSEAFKDNELFGELEPKDSEWTCAGGFATETQIFYITAEDGKMLIIQLIHSAVGLWYPTIQFVFKFYDPATKETIWKSVNVSNFVTPPPGLDKRSCKADEFSVTYKHTPGSDHPESYTVRANLGTDLQLSFDIARPSTAPGWKVGKGPKGGFTYFGPDPAKPEGYAIHRFWPHIKATGHLIHNGKAETYEGRGMMVHAIQGMRPNLLAASWNFANFQSEQHGGVSAIQMEFKTCDSHGRKGPGSGGVWVNIGSLVVGSKLIAVTAETKYPDEEPLNDGVISRTTHLNAVHDPDTSYKAPQQILYEWQAPSILPQTSGTAKAKLQVDVGSLENPKGLIEKVDVLAEIPYVVKMAVNYVAGTKPYIYQWSNPATLSVSGPDSIAPGLSQGLEVSGWLFNEASYIS
ncbi:hypothetical protein DXG03_001750 [Asterophora parasitica]|uniref:Survival factor 1 n=1 Tax=Asterophora parasitica TaxID=117018 RepID=A0A9P7G992_9AGAR|nr:hypothetical protein DXG03_001750 [Asterophora parasitica]